MPKHDGTPNLKPVKTKEEARERGRAGGIASGKARRKKKLMASIYAEMLADKYEILVDDETKEKLKLEGEDFIKYVVKNILLKFDRASVAQLKEMKEEVEKLEEEGTDNELRIIIDDEQGAEGEIQG